MTDQTHPIGKFLETGALARVRRNHGLEHATLHVLHEQLPGTALAGHSDMGGFWIISEAPTEIVVEAVKEALARLSSGESRLAIHPNCGTNFAAAGVMAGLAAGLSMFGVGRSPRENFERLPTAILFATLALIAAQPLGLLLQEFVTTSGEPSGLQVKSIVTRRQGKLNLHRIMTVS